MFCYYAKLWYNSGSLSVGQIFVREITMRQQIEDFLKSLEVEKGYSENTQLAYQNDLTQFLSFLHGQARHVTSWNKVTKQHVISYIMHMKGTLEYASSTTARKVAAVKSFFHYLVSSKLIQDDPTATLDSPRVKKYLPKPVSREQIERLLEMPAHDATPRGYRDKAILELLYATGMRVSEIVALEVGDVDLATGSIRCFGKGGKERIIPIHNRAIRALQEYLEKGRRELLKRTAPEEKSLFLNPRGGRLTRQGLWLIIKGYVREAGLTESITPHTLRHSFAAHMLDGGADLKDVQELLGHANISTTQVYTRINSEHLLQAGGRLASAND